jgi:prepilin-type processing-associated H-X9-DG protein
VKSTQVYQCPSDSNTDVTPQSGNFTGVGFHVSYASIPYMRPGSNADAVYTTAQIESPSTLVYLADAGKRVTSTDGTVSVNDPDKNKGNRLLDDPSLVPAGFGDPHSAADDEMGPNPRHLDTAVVGFADGHVKSLNTNVFYYNHAWMLHPECGSKTGAGNCQ